MNPVIKAQWLAALRNGDYQQGTGRLRDDDHFCCLGVLCDLAAKEGIGKWAKQRFNDDAAFLPAVVVDWAGLTERSPNIDRIPLTIFNDGDEEYESGIRPHTFAEIADLIEVYL